MTRYTRHPLLPLLTRLMWLVCLLSVPSLSACKSAPSAPRVLDDTYLIEEIRFEGVTRFSKPFILKHLYIGETQGLPFAPDYPFDRALLEADAKRLQQLYQAHGYFEAVIVDVLPDINEEDKRVTLTFRVEEGSVTRVERVNYTWTRTPEKLAKSDVEEATTLRAEGPFEVSKYNESLGAIQQALQNKGYPLASVTGVTKVDRVRRAASTTFTITPGRFATIGSVSIDGLVDVPEYLVQREVAFALGEPYSPARMLQIETAVKSLRVFRWVAAARPTEISEDGEVDIHIKVNEADPQSVRLGVELKVDTIRWQQQLRADYTHTNVFGHLTRLDLRTALGWAELPDPFSPELHGPVVEFRPQFTKKGLLEDYLMWSLTPRYRLNLNQGYQYNALSNRLGVSRWFLGNVRASVGHEIDYVDFFNLSPTLDPNASLLGRDFKDPYVLSSVGGKLQLFLVDTIINPKNGAILEGSHAVATNVLGSDFDFQKTVFTAKAYWAAAERLQFATRLKTGWILPFGENPGAPFNRRFYLGGSNTVRGWGSRRLSPRINECPEPTQEMIDAETEPVCESIPVGGYTMVQGNFEARVPAFGPVTVIGFVDMGDVQTGDFVFMPSQWNYSAGPGLRVKTPIGLIRVDLGLRLNETGAFPDERRWSVHFGFGETL